MGRNCFTFFLILQLLEIRNILWPGRESWSRSVSQVPSEVGTGLNQIKPHRAWHCRWEMTDLWASGLQVLECVYLLLFSVRLALFKLICSHCPLCSLRPHTEFFSLGIIQPSKSCSCRSRQKHPSSLTPLPQHSSVRLSSLSAIL